MAEETRKIAMGIGIMAILLSASVLGYVLLRNIGTDDNGDGSDRPVGEWTGPLLDDKNATDDGIGDIVDANNQFGIDVLQKLAEEEDGNIFISPYSIFTALSMTYEGARGNTADEMANVLHLPDKDRERLGSFAKVQNDINKGSTEYDLSTANAIWPQEGGNFKELFLNTIKQYYYGKVQELDYDTDPEACRKTINDWVENQTKDRIKDLIPRGVIDTLTYLVLTNAIYFKGEWVYEFDEDDTEEKTFHAPSGDVRTDMMHLKVEDEDSLPFFENSDMKAVELPYKGDQLSMVLVLPKTGTIDELVTAMDRDMLEEIEDGLEEEELDVYIPKFKLETKYSLVPVMKALGMMEAFGDADFSGMTDDVPLQISEIIHQTFIEVDEKGTEAAAATAVVMRETSVGESYVFNANQPFLYMIRQNDTGNILFMGTMKDPTA
jgi:serpin B